MNTTLHASTPLLNSAFYIGKVFHQRSSPKLHQFSYPLYMTLLDLDEVDYLHQTHWWFSNTRWAPLQFNPADYLHRADNIDCPAASSAGELKTHCLQAAAALGATVSKVSHVLMLTQLRCLGLYFSPVNFFFLQEGSRCTYLLAEVSNTPWHKKHCYLIDMRQAQPITPKTFHVSPFMDLNMDYKWVVQPPSRSALIRIENWREQRVFTAQFSAKRYDINRTSVRRVLTTWPVITATIVKNIYWQAAKLFLKGIAYVPYQTSASDTNQPTPRRPQ